MSISTNTHPPSQKIRPGRHRAGRDDDAHLVPTGRPPDDCNERIDLLQRPLGSVGGRWNQILASLGPRLRIDQRTRRMLAVLLVAVGVGAIVLAWLAWPRSEPASLAVAVSQTSEADPVAAPITVTVTGDVAEPGLVELPAGSRVADAIDAAGGLVPEASTSGYLNLARKISDGELIVVESMQDDDPEPGEPDPGDEEPTDPDDPAPPDDPQAPINLNQATADDLVTLPGVGPVTAQNILDYRETNGGFDSVDQLQDVNGIGPATLAKLADLVTV